MELPNEIMNKIMLFNSHPLADLFKESVKCHLEAHKNIPPESYMSDMTFANYFFHNKEIITVESFRIYYYDI